MEKKSRRENVKLIGMSIVGIITMVMIIVLSTVFVRSAQADAELAKYYAELEDDYKHSVRSYMNEEGFVNAGINITRIVDAEGNRIYTVKIHHSRLDSLDEKKRNNIVTEISKMGFDDERCSFETIIIK